MNWRKIWEKFKVWFSDDDSHLPEEQRQARRRMKELAKSGKK